MNSGTPSILTVILSGLVSGVVVALLNYVLTRKKTQLEIKKLELETERIRVEISKTVEDISATVNYKLANAEEQIIYDISKGHGGYDFKAVESKRYKEDKSVGERAIGTLTIKDRTLIIQRENTEGRLEIWLQQYSYDGTEKTAIPKNELIVGQRKIRVSCQARVVGGEHTVKFVFKNMETGKWLANETRRVSSPDWTPIEVYFQLSPTMDCVLRMDDEMLRQHLAVYRYETWSSRRRRRRIVSEAG